MGRDSGEPSFEYLGAYRRPGVRAFCSELRELYRIGTAIAGEFEVRDGHAGDERSGGWLANAPVGYEFLSSVAVEAFFEDASPPDHSGETTVDDEWLLPGAAIDDLPRGGYREDPGSVFELVPPAELGERAADVLEWGGAYRDFQGSRREARALGEAFSVGMRDGQTEGVVAWFGTFRWCDWFVFTTHWDWTVVVEDISAGRIRLLVATDTD